MTHDDHLSEEDIVEEDAETPVPEALIVDEPPIDLGADPDEVLSLPGRGA